MFLDEIAEFTKKTLDALRQPMEDREVTVTRVNSTNTYPANFMMVAAMNPCPCGFFGHTNCRCTDYEVLKYRQKLSGPILDRMDIQKYVDNVNFFDEAETKYSSKELQKKVSRAREIQQSRYSDIPGIHCNAQISPGLIKEFCSLDSESEQILQKAYERFRYSGRTIHKFIKVARTFADMDEVANIRKADMVKSLMSRDLDKDQKELLTIEG